PRGPVGRARARAPEGTLKIGQTDTGGPVPECSFVGLHRLDVRPQALVVFEIDELDPALPRPIRTDASDGARTIALCDEAFDHIRVLVRDRLVSHGVQVVSPEPLRPSLARADRNIVCTDGGDPFHAPEAARQGVSAVPM